MFTPVHPSPEETICVRYTKDVTPNIYQDDAIAPLPTVDIRKTLAAKLCGRAADAALNAKIIHWAQRCEIAAHAASATASGAGLLLYLVADVPARKVLTAITVVSGVFFIFHTCVSLSWDVLRLVLRTFEFWFLFVVTAANTVIWCLLSHDSRIAAYVIIGSIFAASLTIDANIYSRHLASRFFVLASPALLLVVALTVAHIPPDLHYHTFKFFGVYIEAIDLLVNGNLVIVYFIFILVVRSRHLILTFAPVRHIKCDFYVPLCHLVLQTRDNLQAQEGSLHGMTSRNLSSSEPLRQLKLLREREAHGIDVTEFIIPNVAHWFLTSRSYSALNLLGFVSLGFTLSAFFWTVAWTISATTAQLNGQLPLPVLALATVGLVTASTVVLIHAALFQPKLFRRVFFEVDAWFVSFHVTAVAVGTSDLLAWKPSYVVMLLTAWVWCHWSVFLDALPHVTRRRIRFARSLLLFVSMLLGAFPLIATFTLYISRAFLTNRVLIDVGFGDMSLRSEMLGFVASKLFMLFVWMLRGLWRELMRPLDAFKLLERKVFYRVHG